MLPSFAKQTVTVKRAGFASSRGSKQRDWSNPSTHAVHGCSVQPASTSSNEDRAEQVTDRWELYASPNADVRRGDRVEHGGKTYEVDGDPFEWVSPTGRVTHLHAHLVEWTG